MAEAAWIGAVDGEACVSRSSEDLLGRSAACCATTATPRRKEKRNHPPVAVGADGIEPVVVFAAVRLEVIGSSTAAVGVTCRRGRSGA